MTGQRHIGKVRDSIQGILIVDCFPQPWCMLFGHGKTSTTRVARTPAGREHSVSSHSKSEWRGICLLQQCRTEYDPVGCAVHLYGDHNRRASASLRTSSQRSHGTYSRKGFYWESEQIYRVIRKNIRLYNGSSHASSKVTKCPRLDSQIKSSGLPPAFTAGQ